MTTKSEDGLTHGWQGSDPAEWNNRTHLVPTWRMVALSFALGMAAGSWALHGMVALNT